MLAATLSAVGAAATAKLLAGIVVEIFVVEVEAANNGAGAVVVVKTVAVVFGAPRTAVKGEAVDADVDVVAPRAAEEVTAAFETPKDNDGAVVVGAEADEVPNEKVAAGAALVVAATG